MADGDSSFWQACARSRLRWDRFPDIQVRNGLLRSSLTFAFYSQSAADCWFRIHFCSLHTDDLVELIRDNPDEFVSPWPSKEVLEAFLESERKHPTIAVSQYDLQEGCRLLLRVEQSFMALTWEQKSPAPTSWPPTAPGTKWVLYRGFTKQHRIIVCILFNGESEPIALFAIFLDIDAKRAILLPTDLAESALMFATQYDLDPFHEYGKRQQIIFNENVDYKIETFPPKAKPNSQSTPVSVPTPFSFDDLPLVESAIVKIADSTPAVRELQRVLESHVEPLQMHSNASPSRNRRLCWWCQVDMLESSVHLCGLCNTAVYCSRDCLNLDWNRGLHPAICKGTDRAAFQALPSPLKIYRQMLGELGPQARQMFIDAKTRGFFFLDVRASSFQSKESKSRMVRWIPSSELMTTQAIAALMRLNSARIQEMLMEYCPLLDFIVMLRTSVMLTMHKVAVRDVPHQTRDPKCCCRSCLLTSRFWTRFLYGIEKGDMP